MVTLSSSFVRAVVVVVLIAALVLTLLLLAFRRVCAKEEMVTRLTALRPGTCMVGAAIASALAIVCTLTVLAYGSRNQISTMLANTKAGTSLHLRGSFINYENHQCEQAETILHDREMIESLAALMAGAKYTRTIDFGACACAEWIEVKIYRDKVKTDEFFMNSHSLHRKKGRTTHRYDFSLPGATMIVRIRELVFPDRQTKQAAKSTMPTPTSIITTTSISLSS